MEVFIQVFHTFLYRPLFNALVLIYNLIPGHDFGLAIIILTLLIKALTLPLELKGQKAQKSWALFQPKLKEIQEKYKNNLEEQSRQMGLLFKQEKISPFSGFLPLLVQLPILIALFQLFGRGVAEFNSGPLYWFVANPSAVSFSFLGLINLAQPSLGLAFLGGTLQFFQAKLLPSQTLLPAGGKDSQQQIAKFMQKQTLLLFPLMTFFVLIKVPSALGLYWSLSSLIAIFQLKLTNKNAQPNKS